MDGLHARHDGFDVAHDTAAAAAGAAFAPRTAWSTGAAGLGLLGITLLLLAGLVGCQDAVSLVPNSDPSLRKTKTEFAKDAMTRHPYHAEAPQGGPLNGRAVYDYESNTLQVANFTAEDWRNVELWVNGQWVVFLPRVEGMAVTAKTINFEMLYDRLGRSFPTENQSPEALVKRVEVYRDGKLYELATVPAD